MAAVIRNLVSKNKRRYQEGGFDLDLSYITDNIIAMGFPADKLEGVYRNHIDDVVRFFEQNHPGHYKIYNLCQNRTYNASRFKDRVACYPFEDHHPPNLRLMRPFCEDVHNWLSTDPNNVVAIHCKAGKGRTGVMICAYLMYKGDHSNAASSMDFYGQQRTMDMNGVTIPSQKRYVQYFEKLLKSGAEYRRVPMRLAGVQFEALPAPERTSTCSPYFVVYCDGKKVYKSGVAEMAQGSGGVQMGSADQVVVAEDVRIDFYYKPSRLQKREKLFHFWFNTFFVCPELQGSSSQHCFARNTKSDPGFRPLAQNGFLAGVRESRHSVPEEAGSPSRASPDPLSNCHRLSLKKKELDRAYSTKHFPDNFKVHVLLECVEDKGEPSVSTPCMAGDGTRWKRGSQPKRASVDSTESSQLLRRLRSGFRDPGSLFRAPHHVHWSESEEDEEDVESDDESALVSAEGPASPGMLLSVGPPKDLRRSNQNLQVAEPAELRRASNSS